jgi:nucleotide-binding universal stress UspA family protein
VTVSTIAIGVDGSPRAAKALEMGVEIARSLGARVVLLSALADSAATSAGMAVDTVEEDWAGNPSARVRQILATTQAGVERDGVACTTLVDEGDPGEVLVRLAAECGADILVVGNKGMQRRVVGSVPNTVTHKAECSVLIVKTG